jgi:hypothetical protein
LIQDGPTTLELGRLSLLGLFAGGPDDELAIGTPSSGNRPALLTQTPPFAPWQAAG